MSEQQRVQRSVHQGDEPSDLPAPQGLVQSQGFADLLDEIDTVLEENSADFVRSFVQKGGQ